jgi:hypothetical protein
VESQRQVAGFVEGGVDAMGTRVYWSADTDAFLVNGSAVLTRSYNDYTQHQQ